MDQRIMSECEHNELLEIWSGGIKSGYRVNECNDCAHIVVTYQSLFDGVEYDVSKAVNERDALRAELETAVSHLQTITTAYNYDETLASIIKADRWLRSRES